MAVYTKINKKDIDSINNQFEMEKIMHFKGIKKGIENTNYLLKSKNNILITPSALNEIKELYL